MRKLPTSRDLSAILLFSLTVMVIGISILNYRFMSELLDQMDLIVILLTTKPIKSVP